MFVRFDTITACDGRTHRRTDGTSVAKTAPSTATRSKKVAEKDTGQLLPESINRVSSQQPFCHKADRAVSGAVVTFLSARRLSYPMHQSAVNTFRKPNNRRIQSSYTCANIIKNNYIKPVTSKLHVQFDLKRLSTFDLQSCGSLLNAVSV